MNHHPYKYIWGILSILFLSISFYTTANAATYQSGYLTFTENEDGTLTVTGYNRSKHESPYDLTIDQWYTIDDKIYTVTAIGDSVFKGYTFHSIFIGQGISIGNHTFENVIVNTYKQSNLQNESVSIAGDFLSNVTIGNYAFANAEFHSLVCFGSFTSVGDYAFSGAHFDYLDFSIFQSICHIGNYAFFDTDLSSIISEPQYIQFIGDYAFFNSYMRSFTIYPALQTIGDHAFQEKYSMTFTIHSSTTDISHLHLEPIIWKQSTFNVHANNPVVDYLKELRVPFTIIETGEFYIPEAVVGEIFTYTSSGTYPDPDTAQAKPFTETTHFKVLDKYSVSINQFESNFYSITFSESYTYNNQSFYIKSIETNAFQGKYCPSLVVVHLTLTKVSTIKTGAFSSCSTLETVYLPETIKTIEKNAFPNSSKLYIHIPANVTDISNFDIDNLTNVIFVIASDSPLASSLSKKRLAYQPGAGAPIVYPRPTKGSIIEHEKFQYKITGKNTLTLIKPKNKNISKVTVPSELYYKNYLYTVNKINKKAFYKCKKLKTVRIGNSITYIGDLAFAKCSNLKSITFGTGVKKLGKKVLYYDKKLSTIRFNGTKLQSIGKQTFRKVPKKVNIIVPTSKVKRYSKLIKKAK